MSNTFPNNTWGEAGSTATGNHGTSWMLRILPFMEFGTINKAWGTNSAAAWSPMNSVANGTAANPLPSNRELARTDIKGFYCPTRRSGIRVGTDTIMFPAGGQPWTSGGTDYGGCVGRYDAFYGGGFRDPSTASYYIIPAGQWAVLPSDTPAKRIGMLGVPNVSTGFQDARDGTSNTFMTGELQRQPGVSAGNDGWVVGGAAHPVFHGLALWKHGGKRS